MRGTPALICGEITGLLRSEAEARDDWQRRERERMDAERRAAHLPTDADLADRCDGKLYGWSRKLLTPIIVRTRDTVAWSGATSEDVQRLYALGGFFFQSDAAGKQARAIRAGFKIFYAFNGEILESCPAFDERVLDADRAGRERGTW